MGDLGAIKHFHSVQITRASAPSVASSFVAVSISQTRSFMNEILVASMALAAYLVSSAGLSSQPAGAKACRESRCQISRKPTEPAGASRPAALQELELQPA